MDRTPSSSEPFPRTGQQSSGQSSGSTLGQPPRGASARNTNPRMHLSHLSQFSYPPEEPVAGSSTMSSVKSSDSLATQHELTGDKETDYYAELQRARMDLSCIPKDFLELYPYPAFALVCPIPPPNDGEDSDELPLPPASHRLPFTRSTHSSLHPFDTVWSNSKWRGIARGRRLLECISIGAARQLGDWIAGSKAARTRHSSGTSQQERAMEVPPGLTLPPVLQRAQDSEIEVDQALSSSALSTSQDADMTHPPPPEGFWEPERPPYEDRSSLSGSIPDIGAVSSGEHGADKPRAATLDLDFDRPTPVRLQLTKTSMPIYQIGLSGERTQMTTHTVVVITTVPLNSIADSIAHDGEGAHLHPAVSRLNLEDIPAASVQVPEGPHVSAPSPVSGESSALRTTILPTPGSPKRQVGIPLPPSATNAQAPGTVNLTPTDEIMALDIPGNGQAGPGRPLLFNRDGTVVRQRPQSKRGYDAKGKPLDVAELLETTDWSQTSLGSRATWPQSLRTVVSLIMQYPHQCCLWWGKDMTLIYNAPYAEMMLKHPDLFGMSGPIAWAEIWNQLGPLAELVMQGTSVSKEDDFLLFKQLPSQGTGTFEVYHSWMWVPVVQDDGSIGGLWNATIETTKKVLAERRLATVREMGERTSVARTMKEFNSAVLEILTDNPRDVPFAALYHVSTTNDKRQEKNHAGNNAATTTATATTSHSVKVTLSLAGAIGVPEGHPSTPPLIKMTVAHRHRESRSAIAHITGSPTLSIMSTLSNTAARSDTPMSEDDISAGGLGHPGFNLESWPFKEALQTKRLVLVEDCSTLIKGFPVRVWDELPNAAVVVPVANDSDDGIPSAVMVLGLSIRRPFDDDYESFLHVLRLQLASGLTAVRSYEAEQLRIEELAAIDRAKSMLFSNVSHELRTPLTLVSGPLDDLIQETAEGPKKETLVMARRNVRRLTRLVSTLMDVSRLEAGRLKGSFRLVNLGVMTRDLAALFRGAIERAKLRYVVECDLTPRNVYVDPDHWEKIMFNLIGNAMKYTMAGFVKVSLSYQGSDAVFSVQDSGVGIPASDIDLVGERFHRVQSVSRSHEGTGIGLALIKELIKLHGGSMDIESITANESANGSHGSMFRVRIPLGTDHLPRDAIEVSSLTAPSKHSVYGQGIVDEAMQWNRDREGSSVDSSSDSGGTTGDSSGQSSRGLDLSTLYFKKEDVILLVDDSFDTRRYMRSIFATFCTVIEARDGIEALETIQQQTPDLIISDVMMPRLDGFGLVQKLKANRKTALIPIIMLTARGGEEDKIEGLLAGAEDYLGKPFNARELIARAHMQIQLGKKRRLLEQGFEERTAELRALSDNSPVAIFRSDAIGNITYANPAWYDLTGWPAGTEIVGWARLIRPDLLPKVESFWHGVISPSQTQASHVADWQYVNGKWVSGSVMRIIRLDLVAEGLTGCIGVLVDITERIEFEESQKERVREAEERRVEAEEAKRQQELLIDITSHEIRNPISSLMQCSSLVKTNLSALHDQLESVLEHKTSFVPTRQLLTTINEDLEALESIYQCGLTQERISNDVLSLGRIQLDMLQMFDVETDLRQEAQKVISIFQNEARMKRIALSLKIGESVERTGVSMIKTDPVRLGQVVTNLLSNGIRFTSTSPIRKIELRFDVSFEPPADGSCVMPRLPELSPPGWLKDDMPVYLYVAVTDTGPGLTPKELDMLFQRFSQVSPKTHTIFGGSGLGLYVCRRITDIMGGRIEVASEHGKGSTFRFFIRCRTAQTSKRPAAHTPDIEVSEKRPPMKKRNTGHIQKVAGTGPKPHILVVEDNLINQTVLMRQLKHVGLTCEAASNGQEALDKVRKTSALRQPRVGQPFDAVVMDIEMPVMDGLTALRHIRAEEAAGDLGPSSVIALTGNARQGQIDDCRAAGFDDVCLKPYRLDDLLSRLEEVIRKRTTQAVTADTNVEMKED